MDADQQDRPTVGRLPVGPEHEDELAELYRWPDAGAGRPRVRVNMITSLDGRASLEGRAGGLANPADVWTFAVLRDLADVILVGAGTVRAEHYGGVRLDERRTARRRRWGFRPEPPPIAVVTDTGLDPGSPLFTDTETPPILVCGSRVAHQAPDGVTVLGGDRAVDLTATVRALGEMGFRRILCEGGPTLLAEMIRLHLIDELCLTISPLLVGPTGISLFDPMPRSGPEVHGGTPVSWSLAAAQVAGDHIFARYLRSDPST